ncbi:MAG: PilZ domain-containing protein [Pseudomonadota bacterium]
MNTPTTSTPTRLRRAAPQVLLPAAPIPEHPHLAPYSLTEAADIGAALNALVMDGNPVTVYPSDGTAFSIARVLSVDSQAQRLVLQFAEGRPVPAGHALCVATPHGNKLQFVLEAGGPGGKGQAALMEAGFPLECTILERRGSVRRETPLGQYYVAAFVQDEQLYEFQLYDFSLGGVGWRAAPRDVATLHVGRRLSQVRLELGRDVVLTADLEIRLCQPFRSFLLGQQVQIGCRFVNLTTAMQAELQRALARLEKGRGAR